MRLNNPFIYKIKDDIELAKLLDFGFSFIEQKPNDYYIKTIVHHDYVDDEAHLIVYCNDRILKYNHFHDYGIDTESNMIKLFKTLYDLFSSDIIEEIEIFGGEINESTKKS